MQQFYKLLLFGHLTDRMMEVVVAMREIFGLSLPEAKRGITAPPCLLSSGLTREEADRLAAGMAAFGGVTAVKVDAEGATHRATVCEVVCPHCGETVTEIARPIPEGLLPYLPAGFGDRRHTCPACRATFRSSDLTPREDVE